jgi:hypothetical protein
MHRAGLVKLLERGAQDLQVLPLLQGSPFRLIVAPTLPDLGIPPGGDLLGRLRRHPADTAEHFVLVEDQEAGPSSSAMNC